MTNHYLYAALMLAAGVGIPAMAALNAGLGQQLGSPGAATVTLFAVALACSSFAMLNGSAPAPSKLASVPAYLFLGGACVAFYVFSVTWAIPQFGVANAVLFVLLGQLISAAVIDHFGLLGSLREPMSLTRLVGLLLIVIGVVLARRVAQ